MKRSLLISLAKRNDLPPPWLTLSGIRLLRRRRGQPVQEVEGTLVVDAGVVLEIESITRRVVAEISGVPPHVVVPTALTDPRDQVHAPEAYLRQLIGRRFQPRVR